MAIRMTGDGCRYCQPQEYIDRMSEWLQESRDEANAAIDAKNARIHEYAERHLADSAELEKLDGQLDEAREVIKELRYACTDKSEAMAAAWLERNKE